MAMLNADKYSDLAKYSQSASKRGGPFMSVFITGEPRDGQQVGKMQVMSDFDSRTYVANNKDEVYFVVMFIKRFWEKTEQRGGRDFTLAFGWGDEPKVEGAKYKYVVAGMLLDENKKFSKIPHPSDETKDCLVYFKCEGMKFQSAMDLLDMFSKKTEELPPLSDNPEFEKTVVTPRRYITKTTVSLADSKHGKKHIFKFEAFKKLPDEIVVKFMELSQKHSGEFEKQFNRSGLVSSQKDQGPSNQPPAGTEINPSFGDESKPASGKEETSTATEFDLGL